MAEPSSNPNTGIPVYVMLPLDTVRLGNQGLQLDTNLEGNLEKLKGAGVDGVMVDCWWGLVEREDPKSYDWDVYKDLFAKVRGRDLKLHVVMSFHQCGGNVGDDVEPIPLPKWVLDVGVTNKDIFFAGQSDQNKDGRSDQREHRNLEYLTFGIDNVAVLPGGPGLPNRTALQVVGTAGLSLSSLFLPLSSSSLPLPSIPKISKVAKPHFIVTTMTSNSMRCHHLGSPLDGVHFTLRKSEVDRYMLNVMSRVFEGKVYYDFMHSFKTEMQTEQEDFFGDKPISGIEVGMGPCGELRYPSYPKSQDWDYPNPGEFQCWDKYLMGSPESNENLEGSLREARRTRSMEGDDRWAEGPTNAEHYTQKLGDADFFKDPGLPYGYSSDYGKFFLKWYSDTLIKHGENVLAEAKRALAIAPGGEPVAKLAVKVPGIHWLYDQGNHAAELTAGYYNPGSGNRYDPIIEMIAKHGATFIFTCVEMRKIDQRPDAHSNPEALVKEVFEAAGAQGAKVACENALAFSDQPRYTQILSNANLLDHQDGPAWEAFTYLRLSPDLIKNGEVDEVFKRFVQEMHDLPRGPGSLA